ncbi:dihydrodipicolinate synthase family protein [Neobacillus sp. LXY-4]|uniref:dihydrodipicolinate synthase family protein n=1 Tax=Neobacillus sp. LXY-4 TaxID=3379826 RepID=UPI003EE04600
MKKLQGVFAIMATPFSKDGQLDLESVKTLVEFNIDKGVQGITILGILGEAHKLTEVEREQIIKVVIDQVSGRIPVIVGTSASGTDLAVYYSKRAVELGADGIMVAPPTNVKNLNAVYEYYRRVSSAVDVPVVVQDEPNFSGVLMPAEFLAKISSELPNCKYIKLEEAPTPQKLALTKKINRDVGIFGGNGGVYFLEELTRGAEGTMTGFAFPEILVEIYTNYISGNIDRAREIFYKAGPLFRYEGQLGIGLAIRKEILRRRGAISNASLRHPGLILDQAHLDEITDLLKQFDV